LYTAGSDSCSTVASVRLEFLTRVERVDRVVRDVLANVESSTSEEIDASVMTRVIRSAKARGEAFFFIVRWGEILGVSVPVLHFFLRRNKREVSGKFD